MSATAGSVLPRPQAAPAARAAPRWPHLRPFLACALPAGVLALWQLVTARGWVTPLILPAPGAVLAAFLDLARTGDLATGLTISLERVVAGFAAGATAGLAIGAVTGLARLAEAALRPTLFAFMQVPVLAWIPLLMIPLGIGETLKLVAIGIAAFTPVLIHTARGFRQVSPALVEVGTLYRFSWAQRLRHILLPGALPAVFTGLRLGLTQAWQSLVVVELVASTDGIGYLCVMARQMFQLDQMLAIMVVIGVTGFVLDRVLRSTEDWLAARFGAVAA